jgi:hypothetical protein
MPLINKIIDLHSIKLGDYNYYFMKQLAKWLHLPYKIKRITGTEDADIADRGFKIKEVLAHYNTEELIVTSRELKYIQAKVPVSVRAVTPPITPYPQKGQNQFIENLSIIDTLMNIGPKETRRLIMKGVQT